MSIAIYSRISDATHEKLVALAEQEGRTVSNFVAHAITRLVSAPRGITLEDRLKASIKRAKRGAR